MTLEALEEMDFIDFWIFDLVSFVKILLNDGENKFWNCQRWIVQKDSDWPNTLGYH